MYQSPSRSEAENLVTSVLSAGTGHDPSSCRCGTHFCSVTAAFVKASVTPFANLSPHAIWHVASSGRLVQVWMQARLAKQVGSVTHRASAPGAFCMRQDPIAAPSVAAMAGGATNAGAAVSRAAAITPAACLRAPSSAEPPARCGARESFTMVLLGSRCVVEMARFRKNS